MTPLAAPAANLICNGVWRRSVSPKSRLNGSYRPNRIEESVATTRRGRVCWRWDHWHDGWSSGSFIVILYLHDISLAMAGPKPLHRPRTPSDFPMWTRPVIMFVYGRLAGSKALSSCNLTLTTSSGLVQDAPMAFERPAKPNLSHSCSSRCGISECFVDVARQRPPTGRLRQQTAHCPISLAVSARTRMQASVVCHPAVTSGSLVSRTRIACKCNYARGSIRREPVLTLARARTD